MRSLKHRLQRLEQQMIPEGHELITLIVMPAGAKRPDIDKLPETLRAPGAVRGPSIRLIVMGRDGAHPAGVGGQSEAGRPLAKGNSR
jgi:hypothetical protein